MLREFTQFENNADGGDVHILFDKTAINANAKKKGFTLKTILFLATVGVFILIVLNIFFGFPFGSKKKSNSSNNSEKIYNSDLKMLFLDLEMNFSWITNFENQEIIFNFHFNKTLTKDQYFLIGFMKQKQIFGSDFCLFKDGTVADGYINSENQLKMDKIQDCEIVEFKDFKISIKRKWTTCDPFDYSFKKGTTQVLFLLEMGNPDKLPDFYHVHQIRFFDKIFPILDSENHKGIVFAVENVTFKKDSYLSWCVLSKLDSDVLMTKKHIVGWEPIITPGNEAIVERIEVFWCQHDKESSIAFSGFCNSNMKPIETSNCSSPLAVWMVPQQKFEFPSKTGLPFGGKDFLPWILIRISYSRINNKIIDGSGLKVIYTEKLRKHDSGILQVGISDISDVVIPPKQSDLILNGFCVSKCSEKLEEIHVFGGQFHGHSTATKIKTSIFRNGKRIQTLFAEENFDSSLTTIEKIDSTKIEKGDVILTTCHFDSSDKDQWTNLKDSSEPCVNYLFYYPASDLSFCQSTIDETSLKQFFSSKGVQNNNYSSLNLDKSTIQQLQNFYSTSNLTIQCLKTNKQPYPDESQTWNQESRPRFDTKTIVEKSPILDECPTAND